MAEEVTNADIQALLEQEPEMRVETPMATHEPSSLRPYVFPIALGGLLVTVGLIAQLFFG